MSFIVAEGVYAKLNDYTYGVLQDGFDDEAMNDELLVEELDENQLLECWDDINDFPFDPNDTPNDEDGKRKFILDLIKKLVKNPNVIFGCNIPTC